MKVRNRHGFTLVETSIAVAIIGLLSSIAIPSMRSARTKSIDKAKHANVRMLNNAANLWASEEFVADGTPISIEITNYISGGIRQLDIGSIQVNATNITSKAVGYVFTVEDLY